jgi:purine-binding chemotaxis protein CheW
MDKAMDATQHPQYLTFFIGDEEYAVGILRVREIIQYGGVTRVPRTPPWVRGVINLRGSVVPVIDLAVRFDQQPCAPTRSTCIVIAEVELESESLVVGVLADSVSQVVDLPEADVQPAPSFGTRVRVDYLLGLGRVGERLLLMLDVDRLLSAEEMAAVGSLADGDGPGAGETPAEPGDESAAPPSADVAAAESAAV